MPSLTSQTLNHVPTLDLSNPPTYFSAGTPITQPVGSLACGTALLLLNPQPIFFTVYQFLPPFLPTFPSFPCLWDRCLNPWDRSISTNPQPKFFHYFTRFWLTSPLTLSAFLHLRDRTINPRVHFAYPSDQIF